MAGFSQGGGVGLALANWIMHGDPGFDVWAMDVARFGDWASKAYTNAKVRENYARRFSIRFPQRGTPRRPATEDLADLRSAARSAGAQFGVAAGLEVPLWYAPPGVRDAIQLAPLDRLRHRGRRSAGGARAVGLIETTSFAKYRVSGRGAAAWLDRLLACRLPPPGA